MRRTWALILLIATTWAGPRALAQPPGKAKGEKFALLVGVRSYETPDLRALKYAEADVEELAKVLINSSYRPENVKLMTQKRGAEEPRYAPVAARIRKELDLILSNLDEADSVVVALAGHGVQFKTDEEAYFCPADAQLVDKSPTLISRGTVFDELKNCGAGFKLLMVDACRVNPLTDLGRDAGRPLVDVPSLSRPLRKKPPGGVAALFSCSTGERAFEHPELEHGVFFHFVIKALEGEADGDADGKVDLDELTSFARRRVYRFVENKLGVKQNPEFLGKSNSVAIVDVGRPAVVSLSRSNPVAKVDLGRPAVVSETPKFTVKNTSITTKLFIVYGYGHTPKVVQANLRPGVVYDANSNLPGVVFDAEPVVPGPALDPKVVLIAPGKSADVPLELLATLQFPKANFQLPTANDWTKLSAEIAPSAGETLSFTFAANKWTASLPDFPPRMFWVKNISTTAKLYIAYGATPKVESIDPGKEKPYVLDQLDTVQFPKANFQLPTANDWTKLSAYIIPRAHETISFTFAADKWTASSPSYPPSGP